MSEPQFSDIALCKNCKYYHVDGEHKKNCEIRLQLTGYKHVRERDRHDQTEMSPEDTCANFEQEEKKKQIQETIQKAIRFYTDKKNLADQFLNIQPIYYDQARIWWIWNDEIKCWENHDETDILNEISKNTYADTIIAKERLEILEALKQESRKRKPADLPLEWIQFKEKIFNISTKEVRTINPTSFATNPIPWTLGTTPDTPVMDKLFTDWVGPDKKELLYEIIAYCCYRSYPIHLLFTFIGSGRNGKSQYINLIRKFLGNKNVASTELDGLCERNFESFKLYKKLACFMGETNFSTIKKTSKIKSLTGNDLVGFEMKNKQPFDDVNYAKIIIASNTLPKSEDTSEGFYRRWLIVNFKNEFPEGKDILDSVPDLEFENLACRVVSLLPVILSRGSLSFQGSIEERKKEYVEASDPLQSFIKECCVVGEGEFCTYSKVYTEYVWYLSKHKKRRVSYREFSDSLTDLGFEKVKTSRNYGGELVNGYFVFGLNLRLKVEKFDSFVGVTDVTDVTHISIHPPLHERLTEKTWALSHQSQDFSVLQVLASFVREKGKEVSFDVLDEWYSSMCSISSTCSIGSLGGAEKTEKNTTTPIKIEELITKMVQQGLVFIPRPGWLLAL